MLRKKDKEKLYSLSLNEHAIIKELQFDANRTAKFSAMGFVVGSKIELIKKGNTCICSIKGTKVGISKVEANQIIVERIEKKSNNINGYIATSINNKEEIVEEKNQQYKNNNKQEKNKKEINKNTTTNSKKKILLIGNPNVGKSQIFSRITSLKVVSSNFPGTTVEIKKADAIFFGEINNKSYKINTTIFDIPGLYDIDLENWKNSINEKNQSNNKNGQKNKIDKNNVEVIATKNILDVENYDLILYVLDTEFLERSLNLALLIKSLNKPIIFVLNKYNTAKSKGIYVNKSILEKELNSPVVSIEAISGDGLEKLEYEIVNHFANEKNETKNNNSINIEIINNNWNKATEICKKVLSLEHRHPNFLEKLSSVCVHPIKGIIIAIIVLGISILTIFYSGEAIIGAINNLFEIYLLPYINKITEITWLPKCVIEFLLGKNGNTLNIDGEFIRDIPGLLNEGLAISLIDVLIYFFLFYLIFEILADIGYLPRLAILMDSILHKIGIHGYGIIPILMGFGCKVPAIFSTRILESKRERFIALILILLIFPCISGTSMIFSLAASKNLPIYAPITVFSIIILIGIFSGFILNKIKKGNSSEIFLEIPPLQIPRFKEVYLKMKLRMKEYFFDTTPLIILGIAIINVLSQLNIFEYISNNSVIEFITNNLMGLPKEAAFNVFFGFLRKDVSIGLLASIGNVNIYNYIIACVFMSIYLPCTSTIFVIKREFGIKNTIIALTMTLLISFTIAVLLNFTFKLLY